MNYETQTCSSMTRAYVHKATMVSQSWCGRSLTSTLNKKLGDELEHQHNETTLLRIIEPRWTLELKTDTRPNVLFLDKLLDLVKPSDVYPDSDVSVCVWTVGRETSAKYSHILYNPYVKWSDL